MKLNRTVTIAGAVVVIAAIAVASWFYFNRSGPGAVDPALLVAGPLGEMTLGDPEAPNTVIEYASLTCSHCRSFHENVFDDFKEKYIDTGKVYFILREYPLDPLANAAVMVARCAPEERFFPLVDLMFDQQSNWAFVSNPVQALQNLVNQAGVSNEQFEACLTNQEILDGVTWVKDRGTNEFGVSSTPTFFVNGVRHPGVQTMDDFDAMLGG